MELNGRDLKVRSFGWESGSVNAHPMLEIEPIVVEQPNN